MEAPCAIFDIEQEGTVWINFQIIKRGRGRGKGGGEETSNDSSQQKREGVYLMPC